jgi:hypothetical protein
VWLVRNRNETVTIVEHRIMALLQFSSALEKAAVTFRDVSVFPGKMV